MCELLIARVTIDFFVCPQCGPVFASELLTAIRVWTRARLQEMTSGPVKTEPRADALEKPWGVG